MFELAKRILLEKKVCDSCLGRQYALVGFGLTNQERGKILKNALVLGLIDEINTSTDAKNILLTIAETGNTFALNSLQRKDIIDDSTKHKKFHCELCEGLLERIPIIVTEIQEKLKAEEYESFLIGANMPTLLLEKEDELRAKYMITSGESIKAEFTRELGKKIATITGKEADFNTPDITIIIDVSNDVITLQRRSLFIYGKYNKYIRTIPQTKWPCWECSSKGCKNCNFTGKKYQESVEELIAEPIIRITRGIGTKFHGAGREDIDARMLGNGRPFVLEIREPKIRTLELRKIEALINKKAKGKVSVSTLVFVDKKKVQLLKALAEKTHKTYRAKIELEHEISNEQIDQLKQILSGAKIKQLTPTRVLHRRANLERPKNVIELKIKKNDSKHIEAEITGEGGLYIKELISGDEGRTKPSFSSVLGYKAKCIELDVIYIYATEIS